MRVGDYEVRATKASDLQLVDSTVGDCIKCISVGDNILSYVSENRVYFSQIEPPLIRYIEIEMSQKETPISIRNMNCGSPLILVVSNHQLTVLDTTNSSFNSWSRDENDIIDAVWTGDGNISVLTKDGFLLFFDKELNRINICDSNLQEESYCISILNDFVFVGHKGNVSFFQYINGVFTEKCSFLAHPCAINRIDLTDDRALISSNGGCVVWDRKDHIPLYTIKTKDPPLICDPTATFAISLNQKTYPTLFEVKKGNKKDISRPLPFLNNDSGKLNCCNWFIEPSGRIVLALGVLSSKADIWLYFFEKQSN